ncbi:helix-turn-helix domain-containing protein, partial [Actinocorallia libanotica]|uniref:helix-turn-helix domain-containing protein n=1 Tax=Actinocorallia libanotica TaxID=46162 RepID=UPI0031CE2C75
MSHRNARLTIHGRRLLVERVASGRPVARVAAEMGISRQTAHKWVARWRTEGPAGLHDRPSRPHTTSHRTPAETERRVCALRTGRKLGPARIGPILCRHGLNRLSFLDRPTGTMIRRYERQRPGELVHVDVKKLGRIPDGGGWRIHGRAACPDRRRTTGFDYVHSAVDDHTRIAYSEIHTDEKAATCAAFLERAAAHFADLGITRIEMKRPEGSGQWSHYNGIVRKVFNFGS